MNDKSHRWYHYLMLKFSTQLVIVITAAIIGGIQMIVYETIDQDVVVFDQQCQVNLMPLSLTEMICGDEEVDLGDLQATYLHSMLTTGDTPAIMCVKTVSNYLETTKWNCKMETTEL
jgi:hypothetical protein